MAQISTPGCSIAPSRTKSWVPGKDSVNSYDMWSSCVCVVRRMSSAVGGADSMPGPQTSIRTRGDPLAVSSTCAGASQRSMTPDFGAVGVMVETGAGLDEEDV